MATDLCERELQAIYRIQNRNRIRKRNREHARIERLLHPERSRERSSRYRENHPDRFKKALKSWKDKNSEHCVEYRKKRYSKNKERFSVEAKLYNQSHKEGSATRARLFYERHKIQCNLGRRIREKLRSGKDGKKVEWFLGCSIDFLKLHLESKFKPGMSWDNYGKWHIDHVRPCASFNLENHDQQKECFNWTNLQPLWAKENRSKGARYSI